MVGVLLVHAAAARADGVREDQRGVRVPPVPGIDIPAEEVSRVLYLNRCASGCTISPGSDNARAQTSSIVGQTSLVSPFAWGDDTWNQVVQCVKEVYAPYDVEVTDVDPGDMVLHHEAIVAGDPQELGLPNSVGGIAPSQCVPRNNVISFTFANSYSSNAQAICSVIGQETAHSYGLEHAFNCADPMTYLRACGRQFFRDVNAECGEYEPRELCQCGGARQNSHRWLRAVLGANPTPVPGPDLTVASPADGAAVTDGFRVSATATHMRGVGHVDVYLNGTLYTSIPGNELGRETVPYTFDAPAELADGVIDVEVHAFSDIETETVETVTVTKGDPCASATDCTAGQACDNGRCYWPPPTGQLGDACASDAECVSGICATNGSEGHCSQSCFPTPLEETCPDGFHCESVSPTTGTCWPASANGGGGGGCQSGSGAPAGLILLAALALLRRRAAC